MTTSATLNIQGAFLHQYLMPIRAISALNIKTARILKIILITFLTTMSQPCSSQIESSTEQIDDTSSLDELSGIIIDRTITVTGHHFYRYFSDRLLLVAPDTPENLIIHERPSARWGNLIWVEYNAQRLYSIFWNPRIGDIGTIAKNAADEVNNKLSRLRLTKLFSDTFDLEKDEF